MLRKTLSLNKLSFPIGRVCSGIEHRKHLFPTLYWVVADNAPENERRNLVF